WHLLSSHPEVEASMHAELRSVLGDRAPTPADYPRLRYTKMVFQEVLRLYPPAWIFSRTSDEDITIGGYVIPKNNVMLICPYVAHRDPRYFEDPDAFRPERFADGLESRLPNCAYLPFGAGTRMCIGESFALMEATLILATVAQRYRLTGFPGQEVE